MSKPKDIFRGENAGNRTEFERVAARERGVAERAARSRFAWRRDAVSYASVYLIVIETGVECRTLSPRLCYAPHFVSVGFVIPRSERFDVVRAVPFREFYVT